MNTRAFTLRLAGGLAVAAGLAACTPTASDRSGSDGTAVDSPTDAAEQSPPLPTAAPALPTPMPAETIAAPPDAAAGKLSLTETYTNTVYGYALDYPTDWFVNDSGQSTIVSSFDVLQGVGGDGVPPDQTKIDILALEGFPLDLEARVAQIEAESASAGSEVVQESMALGGGEPAVWLTITGGMAGNSGIVVTIMDGELYQLQAYGNAMPLPAIARTLRPAAKAEPPAP